MPLQTVLIAFGLTLFAGLATGVGSTLAFFAKRTNARFLSGTLGFSAEVRQLKVFTQLDQQPCRQTRSCRSGCRGWQR